MERNDGSPERPYFADAKLLKVLGKKNLPVLDEPIEPIYETPL